MMEEGGLVLPAMGGIMKEIRRVSDPDKAQIIWDGIKTVRAQKQIPALPRLSRYMNRNYKLDKDTTQRLLDLAVEDNLVKLHKKVGTKGNKAGVEEDAYRLPTEDMLPFERHDWYCFHCHAGGEVVLCRDCHRVYHQSCLKEELHEQIGFVCSWCKIFQNISAEYDKNERLDMNNLLYVVTTRLKEKLPSSILSRAPPPPAKNPYLTSDRKATIGEGGIVNSADREAFASFGEEKWRAKFLLKRSIDLDEVLGKCQSQQYRILDEYRADIHNIVHNVVIYHGNHSLMADQAKMMFRACTADLNEISTCRDCFRYGDSRGDKYWFAKPCRPFHEILYAKQAGYPFWPAKVVRNNELEPTIEVRFFGGYHQRATVDRNDVKPITTNIHTLNIKKNSAWNKASEELSRYQDLFDKCANNPEFLASLYGDPFGGEKVSQLTGDKFGMESESESDEPNNASGGCSGEPGSGGVDPLIMSGVDGDMMGNNSGGGGTISLVPMDIVLAATAGGGTIKTEGTTGTQGGPTFLVPPQMAMTPRPRPPTKLRRIEPKPVPGSEHIVQQQPPQQMQQQQQPQQLQQQQQQQQTMVLPLTVVTVPQQLQLQPHQLQLQQQHIQLSHPMPQLSQHQPLQHIQPLPSPQQLQHITIDHHQLQEHLPFPQLAQQPQPPQQQPQLHQMQPAQLDMQQQEQLASHQMQQQHQQQQQQHQQQQQQMQQHQQNMQQMQQQQQLHQPPPQLLMSPPLQQLLAPQPEQQQLLLQPPPPPAPTPMDTGEDPLAKQQQQQQEASNLLLLRPQVKEEVREEGEGDDAVSSSSQMPRFINASVQTPNKLLRMVAEEICGQNSRKPADRELKEFAEKLRAEFEQEKRRAVNVATRSLERDLERLKADHATELENLQEKQRQELAEMKKKQWCYNCEVEAIYWCCWNTAYCSTDCQQQHWHREHKRMCRRKR